MNVSEVMSPEVVTCNAQASDDRAARLLWEHDCGTLPVVDEEGRVLGMVTDRDLCMAAYTRGRALSGLHVSEAMSSTVVGCRPDDSLVEALEVMRDHQVRRLPVLDDEGRVVGLLSMNDVARALRERPPRRGKKGLEEALLEALGAVCELRRPPEDELVPAKPRKKVPRKTRQTAANRGRGKASKRGARGRS